MSRDTCPRHLDNLFGPRVAVCRRAFDFTIFFEEAFLSIVPNALFFALVALRLIRLRHRPPCRIGTRLRCIKLLLLAIFASVHLSLLVLGAVAPAPSRTPASAASLTLAFIAAVVAIPMSSAEDERSLRPSSVLSTYFFVTLLFDAARTRTVWLDDTRSSFAGLFTVNALLRAFLVVLETWPRSRGNNNDRCLPPEATANIFSQVLFLWVNPLLWTGYRSLLCADNIFRLDPAIAEPHESISKSGREKLVARHSLLLGLIWQLRWQVLSGVVPRLCTVGFKFAQPFLIRRLVTWATQPDDTSNTIKNSGYGLVGAFILVYVGLGISNARYQHLTNRLIITVRSILVPLIFQRTLQLSTSATDERASVTLMSTDIERISSGLVYVHDAWGCVLEVALALGLLWIELGFAAIVPVILASGCTLTITFVAKGTGIRQKTWVEAIQQRVAITSGILKGIKTIKMTGLSEEVSDSLRELRRGEIRASKRMRQLQIFVLGVGYLTTAMSPVISFAVYVLRKSGGGIKLDATTAFTVLSTYALLGSPLNTLTEGLSSIVTVVTCIERIREFLNPDGTVSILSNLEEPRDQIPSHMKIITPQHHASVGSEKLPAVRAENYSAKWEVHSNTIIAALSFVIPHGSLTIVLGPVGSGKSTLLRAILGEMPFSSGSLYVNGNRTAYCSQSPWIRNVSVQENITNVLPMERDWYQCVLKVCLLEQDIAALVNGDETILGSSGSVLSGGQKQRIALARALYSRPQLLLLDDVFCGLDNTTEEAISQSMFATAAFCQQNGITTICASSSLNFLPMADHIIVLDSNGEITCQGSFNTLMNKPSGYLHLLDVKSRDRKDAQKSFLSEDASPPGQPTDNTEALRDKPRGDLETYMFYFRAFGTFYTLLYFGMIAVVVFLLNFPSVWVKLWTTQEQKSPGSKTNLYLGVYFAIGGLTVVGPVLLCSHLLLFMVPRASFNIHQRLSDVTLGSPLSIFSRTDIGVTINRFSQDLGLIDSELPIALLNTCIPLGSCVVQMVVISVSARYIAATMPFCIVVFYFVQRFYLNTARQLRLLDIEAKAPLFSHFLETIDGLVTIRASKWTAEFALQNKLLLDKSQKPMYALYCVQKWLNLVLDFTSGGIAIVLAGVVVAMKGSIDPGFVGLAFVNIISFNSNLKLLVTYWTQLETSIGAIYRIKKYADDTPAEDLPHEIEQVPPQWPDRGVVELHYISASYGPSHGLALEKVNLRVEAGSKLGICGRSGSGKSTLLSILVRLLDSSEGYVTIDAVPIATLPRQLVRSRLNIIAQEPFFLIGSIRLNLDPFGVSTDEQISACLGKVSLYATVLAKGGLDAPLTDGTFSHGQRQLVSLARAILKKESQNAKILVLDEATSSLDQITERTVQRVLREEFEGCTIIAVAHHLETIMDFDLIAVLDGAKVVEYGVPSELLKQEDSAFTKLYKGGSDG
ncbi:ABC transporter-like protein [Cucurbitaria berberidis CBS 394.84]|uniref:ABC transporter-like protein n=1 Tax=Cucurbitaria berberidis CBS 394.84 TaxID=1168544 RepID=A0A9P4GDC8_9PLEO|nr:ABC transporter-like protein [Cucurbitaria berberidis CBS 394.84]KAF1843510.1 ABC transporter-like protein [Cucurbitaria berberidis CBS 394.84]